MRPAKLAACSVVLPAPSHLPSWVGSPTSVVIALDYVEKKAQKGHAGMTHELDALALSTLVQQAVCDLNSQAPHQPPIQTVQASWSTPHPLSGLRFIDLVFFDTQGRVHDRIWAAEEWCTRSGPADKALGQWPFDERSRRLGGGWEHWFRVLGACLPSQGAWQISIPQPDPGPDVGTGDHQEAKKRPETHRRGTVPR